MTAMGHEVLVAGAGGRWKHRRFDPGYPMMRWPRIPWVPPETARERMLRWTRRRFAFDVVHAHTTYPNGHCAARALPEVPLVITPHGADIHKVPEIGFGRRLDPEIDRKISGRWHTQTTPRRSAAALPTP